VSRPTIEYNVLGISEVPSEARNLDEALAQSDMHLLGVGDSPEVSVSERRVGGDGRTFILNHPLVLVLRFFPII